MSNYYKNLDKLDKKIIRIHIWQDKKMEKIFEKTARKLNNAFKQVNRDVVEGTNA